MTQTLQKRASALDSIDAMLKRVGGAQKAAEANTEAGGFQGGTTHPVADVEDRTQDAQEGARSAENTADVKEDQGSESVDSTAPGTPGGQDSVQLNIGTNQSATGEDSTVETESAKGGKDDPGTQRGETAHPAKTDNDALDGHKYAMARELLQKVAVAQEKGNAFLAELATGASIAVQAKAAELQKKQAKDEECEETAAEEAAEEKAEAAGDKEAAEAGYDLADAIARGGLVEGQQKVAQDTIVVQTLQDTVQEAWDMADKTAQFLDSFEATKRAMDEEDPNRESEPDGDEGGGPPANPPEAAGADEGGDPGAPPADPMMGGEGGGGNEEQALLEMLTGGGGGDIGGEQALEGMAGGDGGGMPPEGGGMPPEGGGMPPEGGGMPPEGGGGLEALLGGGGGGMPPEGGGMPPEGGGMPPMGGMPPEGGGMPPEGGMPPGGGGMPGMEGGMPPEGGGMPGMEGGMPPEGGGIPGLEGLSEEDIAMLLAALQQQGIDPGAFEAKAAAYAAKALNQKIASGAGVASWRPKTGAEAAQFQKLVNYVKEVAGR